jgi:hypothetical protein
MSPLSTTTENQLIKRKLVLRRPFQSRNGAAQTSLWKNQHSVVPSADVAAVRR